MPENKTELPMHQIMNWLDRIKRMPEEERPGMLEDLGDGLIGEAQVNAPVKSGFLSESHYRNDFDGEQVIIGVNADYALPVHEKHPTKSRWFWDAVVQNFARIGRKVIIKRLRERGAE